MILYDHPLSSYGQKVKIALREKGIAFTRVLPDDFGTGRQDTSFAAANPRTKVPVLIVEGGQSIFDSTIILDYLDERWPGTPLMPRDPLARARQREVEEIVDGSYEAVDWGYGEILWFRRAEGALAADMRHVAATDTRVLQAWLTQRLGDAPWFGGEAFGRADAAVAPMVNRSVHYGLGPVVGSPLAQWHERVSARPSVAETFAEFEAAAAHMAQAADHYRSGGRRREYRDHRLEWMIRSGGMPVVLDGLREDNIRFSWPG